MDDINKSDVQSDVRPYTYTTSADPPQPTPGPFIPLPDVLEDDGNEKLPGDVGNTRSVRTPRFAGLSGRLHHYIHKVSTREGWLGDYDFAWLCLPVLPFSVSAGAGEGSGSNSSGGGSGNGRGRGRKRGGAPFYALDADLPLLMALICGLQHALAMLAGIITPPIIISSALRLESELQAYMISASLISCGIMSMVQISRVRLWGNKYLGSGLLSVVGTSFATLSTANTIFDTLYKDGTCPTTVGAQDGSVVRGPCPAAYGVLLGTSLVCSFTEIFLSFVPVRILRRVFPPLVTGVVILIIGTSLIGESGIPNWGGGANDCKTLPTDGIFQLCPTIFAPRPLPWGSPEFIGLGFLSFITIVLVELFGSPFLKSASIIVGLVVGCVVAGAAGYIDASSIDNAPVVTFLWVHTFELKVYPPAILPMIAVYIAVAMEAIGDITASAEVSRLKVEGPEFDSRIQGGVLADGVAGFFCALFMVTPLSVFAQNNGVIALTRCASRTAGKFCCAFLILFGVLGKLSGVFLAIPNPVLGGVTSFLFANVSASGIRVLCRLKWTRRDRFILAAALAFGFGNLMVPGIFAHLFDAVENPGKGLKSLFDSIGIVLSTPFLIAGLVAVILNLIVPEDSDEPASRTD